MQRIFDMDNPLMRALAAAADLLVMNILTLILCLPVVTAGGAIAGMNDVFYRQIRGEEGYLLRSYFRAFSSNFKKATALWGIVFLALLIVAADYLAAGALVPALRAVVIAVGVLVLAWAMYAFGLLIRYEAPLTLTMKNAAALMVGYFPRTLGMVAFTGGFWLLALHFWRIGWPLLLMFGLSLPCYVGLLLLKPIFDKLEGNDSSQEKTEDTE